VKSVPLGSAPDVHTFRCGTPLAFVQFTVNSAVSGSASPVSGSDSFADSTGRWSAYGTEPVVHRPPGLSVTFAGAWGARL
jgi:hypothetical protein